MIIIKIENLHEGMEIKSYKQLCEILGERVKGGDSKKAQMKEFERFIDYSKEGNKFIIKKIYENPMPKLDGRSEGNNSIYNDLIQLLILDMLARNNNNGQVLASKTELLKTINMINQNYCLCCSHSLKLSQYMDIQESIISDFYNTTTSSINKSLITALDNLRDKSLIFWDKVTCVCVYNYDKEFNYQEYRIATPDEKADILEIETKVLKEMGYEKISQVRISPHWKQFRKTIIKHLKEKTDIRFYYTGFDIIINEVGIKNEYNKLLNLLLPPEQRDKYKTELNCNVMDRTKNNANNRQIKALKGADDEIELQEDDKLNLRADNKYLQNINRLIELLISEQAINISNEVRNIKLKNNDDIIHELLDEM